MFENTWKGWYVSFPSAAVYPMCVLSFIIIIIDNYRIFAFVQNINSSEVINLLNEPAINLLINNRVKYKKYIVN